MATIASLANETLCKIMGMLKEPTPGWASFHYLLYGRYNALRAAALVCSRRRDPAQRALHDEVEVSDLFQHRTQRLLATPRPPRHTTRALWVFDLEWHKALAVVELYDGLQYLKLDLHVTDLSVSAYGITGGPILPPGHSLPAGLTSLALGTPLDENAAAFLAAISSASEQSLTKLHLRITSRMPTVTLRPALSNIGPHLQTFIFESKLNDVLESCIDTFPTFKTLHKFSWKSSATHYPLKAADTEHLCTILDAFPSPATLRHLSIGTNEFASLEHIRPALAHPTLSILTKLDLPSLPASPPIVQPSPRSRVDAMAKACEDRGIRWSMGGVTQREVDV